MKLTKAWQAVGENLIEVKINGCASSISHFEHCECDTSFDADPRFIQFDFGSLCLHFAANAVCVDINYKLKSLFGYHENVHARTMHRV